MRKLVLFLIVFPASHQVFAQGTTVFELGGGFFIALLAGVALAFGFQALLTLISVAAGINIAGPLNRRSSSPRNKNEEKATTASLGPKISAAMGAWTLITVSISLFFASWLAVKLIMVENNTVGLILGLVIWAAFYTMMMYLEMRSVSSLAGGLFNIAVGAVRSSFSSLKSLFETGKQRQLEGAIDHSIDRIRQELSNNISVNDIVQRLDEYVDRLHPEPVDYNRVEEELKNIINEVEIEQRQEVGDKGLEKRTFIQIAEKQPNLSKEDVRKLGGVFDKIRAAGREGSTRKEKVVAGFDKLMPGTEEDTARLRQKIASYLRNTNAEDLQPEVLERDLERIVNEPKAAREVILNRVSHIDKETLVELVKSGGRLDDSKARTVVDKAESALNRLKSFIQSAPSLNTGDGSESVDSLRENIQHTTSGAKINVEMRLREFFNSMQRPEFNYERMKLDFMRMFRNPGDALDILKRRFDEYDRESLVTLLSKKKNLSRQDAENILRKFDETKEQIVQEAENIERQAREKVEQAKQFALDQAEAARKTAAAAAWWLVGAAVISGGAAALGGVLAYA